jgi:hypothetical protein
VPSDKPLWWKAFDAAERALAPRVEGAVRSDPFLDALGLAARAQSRVRRDLEARSRAIWHLVNLPAGSDVRRLRRQVADLDRELRQVSMQLQQALAERPEGNDKEEHDAVDSRGPERRPARPRRAAGSRSP